MLHFAKTKNHKVFTDNFFTSLPLIQHLKSDGIWYTEIIHAPRLKIYRLLAAKDIKKKGRSSFYYRSDENRKIVVVKWFDNKVVALASFYVGIEPTDAVKCSNCSIRQHVHVSRPNTVRLYNQYMGGINKLDKMCSLYNLTLRSRRWYIYLWLHWLTIAVVNAWFLYHRNTWWIDPQEKTMPYVYFKQMLQAVWVVQKPH